jgi:hypothetical protein
MPPASPHKPQLISRLICNYLLVFHEGESVGSHFLHFYALAGFKVSPDTWIIFRLSCEGGGRQCRRGRCGGR